MHLRRVGMSLVLLGLAALSLISATPARAAPTALAVVFGPPAEGAKVTLDDTSIDGPALWSSPTGSPKAILAWTGTDTQHRLNYMTSTDGLQYANKHILADTSPWRPAVTFDSGGRAGFIVVAWTGRDAAHTLNVEYIDAFNFAVLQKLTLWGNTSFSAPAIAVFGGGTVALAWTDQAQTLNVLRISNQRQVLGKTRLEGWGSLGTPDLSLDRSTNQLILSWAGLDERTGFATSTNAIQWTVPSAPPIQEWTAAVLGMIGINATNMPIHWLAWSGTLSDSAHHLNAQYTESFPNWVNANSKTTFGETSLGGPALGYLGVNRQLLITWTGTDAAHHLNVAVIFVNA